MRSLLTLFAIHAFACLPAFAQTKQVLKTISTNGITESLVVPSGKTLTIASGATLTAASGSTITGIGSGLTIGSSTITSGTSGRALYNNSGVLGELDLASLYAPIASPTFTGTITTGTGGIVSPNPLFPTRNITISQGTLSWQNVGGSGFGVQLTPTTPTADRFVSFNPQGNLVSTADTGTITSTMILDGTIANADLAGSIAISKLATTGTASASTYLRGDGAWTAIDLSSYLTTATAASTYLPLAGGTLTGALVLPAGSVSAPSLRGSDADTGIYFTAAGFIDFTINGTRRVYIDTNGTLQMSGAGIQITNGNLISNSNYFSRGGAYYIGASDNAAIFGGSGSPEGAVTGKVGSLYLRFDGGAGTTLYVKESGTGNTGWVAK